MLKTFKKSITLITHYSLKIVTLALGQQGYYRSERRVKTKTKTTVKSQLCSTQAKNELKYCVFTSYFDVKHLSLKRCILNPKLVIYLN